MKIKITLIVAIIFSCFIFLNSKDYAVSIVPTTMYNTPNINNAYKIENDILVSRDESGLVREIETQTFPNTAFRIYDTIKKNGTSVYKVKTKEYWNTPNDFYFYIDSRAVKKVHRKPSERIKTLSKKEVLLKRLYSIKDQTEKELIPYIWGGNTLQGIPQHKKWYVKNSQWDKLSDEDKKQITLQGLDCTGLIYYITDGYTPRNSTWLRNFGTGVKIEDKDIDEIISQVKPLDIIVHRGHALLILNKNETIESRLSKGGGVVITPIKERFEEIMESKIPLNAAPSEKSDNAWFIIRRFIY